MHGINWCNESATKENHAMTDNPSQATESNDKRECEKLPDPPKVPEIPERGKCPQTCDCPSPPGGEPQTCLDDLIRKQNIIVKQAERAKAFADELTEIQNKVKSAQADYTQARFSDLRKLWKDQDGLIVELIRKLVCAVDCWECLLACRLCNQLSDIRRLEDRLNGAPGDDVTGTGPLTKDVHSLFDLQAWHERNVAQMAARMKRITDVMGAWDKPSGTLGDVLEKNGNLIKESQNLLASDSAKVVFDVFMTLIPRHWAIRPRDQGAQSEWKSGIDMKYVTICECPQDDDQQSCNDGDDDDGEKCQCDEGMPDDCCGPDVGILSLRQRLVGVLPYIVDPAKFPALICCLTNFRLSPASDQLAQAQAYLAATTAEIELVRKQIDDKKAAIEASFRDSLANPIDCTKYKKKPPPTTSTTSDRGNHGNTRQSDQTPS